MKNLSLIQRIPLYFGLMVLTLIAFFPFYIMIIMGTYINEDLFTGIKLLPGNYLLENLKTVFSQNIGLFYWNSLYIAVCAGVGAATVSSMAGYAFAKLHFKMKNILFLFIMSTLMIPATLGLVGFALEMSKMGLQNNHLALIIPPMASAFGIFWMTQYIRGAVPNDLLDCAKIDGCNEYSTFFRIVTPSIKGGLFTIFLLSFLGSFNSYMAPLVLLNRQSLYTIPLGITMLSGMFRVDNAARILCLSFVTIPLIIVISFGAKYLEQGLLTGSLKG